MSKWLVIIAAFVWIAVVRAAEYGSVDYPAYSCYDILVRGDKYATVSGWKWLQRGSARFGVYCDQTTQGGGWAVIESLSVDGAKEFRTPAFSVDRPIFPEEFRWHAHRLTSTSMNSLCPNADYCNWRATCEFNHDLIDSDFITGSMKAVDIINFQKGCAPVSEVNLLGALYQDINVNFGSTHCNSECHQSINTVDCGSSATFPGTKLDENFFGEYLDNNGDIAYANPSFRCTRSQDSVTTWWIQERIDCPSKCSRRGYCRDPSVCICEDNYFGSDCEITTCNSVQSSSASACSGHGSCVGYNQCSCSYGWTGTYCDTFTCFGYPHTNSNACSGRGTCNNIDTCACIEGYVGSSCAIPVCFGFNKTDIRTCSGHGTCTAANTCVCSAGYTGEKCDIPICNGVPANNSATCSANGQCVSANNCNCNLGYSGPNCEIYRCGGIIFDDQDNVCSGFGQCTAPETCNCIPEYFGANCESWTCNGIEATNSSVCSKNGECYEPNKCRCSPFFTGTNCEVPLHVSPTVETEETTIPSALSSAAASAEHTIIMEETAVTSSFPGVQTSIPALESTHPIPVHSSTASVFSTIIVQSSPENSTPSPAQSTGEQLSTIVTQHSSIENPAHSDDNTESSVSISFPAIQSPVHVSSSAPTTASSIPTAASPTILISSSLNHEASPVQSSVPHLTCFDIDSQDAKVCNGNGACVAKDNCICASGFTGVQCEIREFTATISSRASGTIFNRKKSLRAEAQITPVELLGQISMQWQLLENNVSVSNLGSLTSDGVITGRLISLKPDSLKSGLHYVLQFTARLQNQVVKRSVEFETSVPPVRGNFVVGPSLTGTALTTLFDLSVSGWTASSDLTYSFGYLVRGVNYTVSGFSSRAAVHTTLPAGDVTVFVIGRSNEGDEARMESLVVVSDISGPVAEVLEEQTNNLASLNDTDFYASVATITASINLYVDRINKTDASHLIDNVILVLSTKPVVTTPNELKNQVKTIAALTSQTSLVTASSASLSANILISNLATVYSDDDQDSAETLETAIQVTVNLAIPLFSTNTSSTQKKVLRSLLREVSTIARAKLTDNKKQELSLNNLEQVLFRSSRSIYQLEITVQTPRTYQASRSLRSSGIAVTVSNDVYSNSNMTTSGSLISQITASATSVDADIENRVAPIIAVELYNDRQQMLLFDGNSVLLNSTVEVSEETNATTTYTCRYFDSATNTWINDTSVCWKSSESGMTVTCSCTDTVTHSVTLDYVQAIVEEEAEQPTSPSKGLSPGAIAGIVIAIATVVIIVALIVLVAGVFAYKNIKKQQREGLHPPTNIQMVDDI